MISISSEIMMLIEDGVSVPSELKRIRMMWPCTSNCERLSLRVPVLMDRKDMA